MIWLRRHLPLKVWLTVHAARRFAFLGLAMYESLRPGVGWHLLGLVLMLTLLVDSPALYRGDDQQSFPARPRAGRGRWGTE